MRPAASASGTPAARPIRVGVAPPPGGPHQDVAAGRTQGQADAELAAAQGHRRRDGPVDAERRQQHRRDSEAGDGRRVEAGARQGSVDNVVHPLDRRERHVLFQLAQHRLDRRSQSRDVGVRADDELAGLVTHPRLLRLRRVDARRGRKPQGELAHVADDPDDFDLQRPAPVERQASSDGVLRAEVDAGQRFR